MKTAPVSVSNYRNTNLSKANTPVSKASTPAFKMNNAKLIKEGVEDFIQVTHSDAGLVRKMFERIQNHFNKIGGECLHFEIQPTKYAGGAVNVRSFFDFNYDQKIALANKYKRFLNGKDYQNLSGSGYGTTRYIVNDITKPMEIFQMTSPRRGDKFKLAYQDDKTIADIIERSFPVETTERKILLKMIDRPHNFFKSALRWLDTHGPDFPPIN